MTPSPTFGSQPCVSCHQALGHGSNECLLLLQSQNQVKDGAVTEAPAMNDDNCWSLFGLFPKVNESYHQEEFASMIPESEPD